jgi:NAD(P)-dependent dehydrogenase (short-subunit alcohol dehydrogenase family)
VRVCAICPGSIDTRMYPSDRRVERAGATMSIPASPFYLANSVLTIVTQGHTGEIWLARPDDKGFFTYRMPRLPPAPVTEDLEAGRRFVPASVDGTMLAGKPIGG